jgi:DNA (cytosine-5)-methyltransferase 1
MGGVLGDLSGLGYDAEWGRIAAETVGAPHLRWRIFIVAYASNRTRRSEQGQQQEIGADFVGRGSEAWLSHLAYPAKQRSSRSGQPVASSDSAPSSNGKAIEPLNGRLSDQWAVEPDVGRVAYGVSARVDQLTALGNAVVPQVAEVIGRRLMELGGETKWQTR